jgi:hypothetical protein
MFRSEFDLPNSDTHLLVMSYSSGELNTFKVSPVERSDAAFNCFWLKNSKTPIIKVVKYFMALKI